jgi:N-sulfoglucosamine sulfohydrolase
LKSPIPEIGPKRVVLLIADDWSPLGGCYGHAVPETPHLDALATMGTVFHNAYCTTPSCGPSRACILTGQHSYTHGQYGNPHGKSSFRLNPQVRSFTRDLKDAGVVTGMIGKRHILPLEPLELDFYSQNDKVISKDRTLSDLNSFLELAGKRDFFLMLAPYLPHRTSLDGFDHANYSDLPMRTYAPEELEVPGFLPNLPGVRSDLANYYSAVTRFDHWVGIVVEDFKRRGLFEETLFVVMSDHGMPFLGAKASPFEGGHRCPLIISCPGRVTGGRNSRDFVNWLDIAPTMTEWFGAKIQQERPGNSLLPLLEDGAPERDEVYLAHMFHGLVEYYPYRILRKGRWKLILRLEPELDLPVPTDIICSKSFEEIMAHQPAMFGRRKADDVFYGPEVALYDLETDPWESENLAGNSKFETILTSMLDSMASHRKATGDPLLQMNLQTAWKSKYPRPQLAPSPVRAE